MHVFILTSCLPAGNAMSLPSLIWWQQLKVKQLMSRNTMNQCSLSKMWNCNTHNLHNTNGQHIFCASSFALLLRRWRRNKNISKWRQHGLPSDNSRTIGAWQWPYLLRWNSPEDVSTLWTWRGSRPRTCKSESITLSIELSGWSSVRLVRLSWNYRMALCKASGILASLI